MRFFTLCAILASTNFVIAGAQQRDAAQNIEQLKIQLTSLYNILKAIPTGTQQENRARTVLLDNLSTPTETAMR